MTGASFDPARLRARCAGYGITTDQFLALLYVQDFSCRLCRRPLDIEGKGGSAIDHCHATCRVRGLLCFGCNVVLGKVEKLTVERIATYLSQGPRIGHSERHLASRQTGRARGGQLGSKRGGKTAAERQKAYRARKRAPLLEGSK